MTQPLSRKLLALCALTFCCLTGALVAAAEEPSKVAAQPSPVKIHPGRLDQGAPDIAPLVGCGNLEVFFGSPSTFSVKAVACDHGYHRETFPPEGTFIRTTLEQSLSYGPDCTITVSNGAIIKVQQNYCAYEAGHVTVKLIQGPAEIVEIKDGSWAESRPGRVWVKIP